MHPEIQIPELEAERKQYQTKQREKGRTKQNMSIKITPKLPTLDHTHANREKCFPKALKLRLRGLVKQ
jgi:hypothetical protein